MKPTTGLMLCEAILENVCSLREYTHSVQVMPAFVIPVIKVPMNVLTADINELPGSLCDRSDCKMPGQNILPPDFVPIVGTKNSEGDVCCPAAVPDRVPVCAAKP
jgi:hypothetical protein